MDVGYQFRALVSENISLKLLSLTFALVLYSLVHGSQEAQRALLVNVQALTPPEAAHRALMTAIPPQIRVTVRGPSSAFEGLNADHVLVQLDLQGGNETRVSIEPSMIPLPPGLKVEQIDPPAIDLAWEDVVVRDIPVEVGVLGKPAPGFVLRGAPAADPTVVRASGPKSEVMVLQRAGAESFDVNGLTEGKHTQQLAVKRPGGRVSFDTATVTATVDVAREVVERPFTRVGVVVIGRANAKAQPAEVDVRVSCPPEVVLALRPELVVPRAQVTSTAEHGSDAIPVLLSIDQCTVHVTPPSVIVRW
jgi:hypothetical protein